MTTAEQRRIWREKTKSYYDENQKQIRINRLKNKLQKGPQTENIRLSSIEKYGLQEYAEENGWDVSSITVNRMDSEVSRGVNAQITQRVEKRLEEYDKEIKRLMGEKAKQLQNFVQNRPLKEGDLTLQDTIERIGHIPIYKETTRENYQKRLENLFKHILKDKGDNVVGTFNDYKAVIKKISNAKQFTKGKGKGKEYADLSHFYNMPVTLYNNVLEFRSGLSYQAYQAYKDAYVEERNKGVARLKQVKYATEYPDIQELHLVRRLYATHAPASIWHLVSALYTLTPAVRNDYGCVHLITKTNKVKNNGRNNYYNVQKGEFILNSYKTDKRYGTLTYQFDKRLVNVINLWLEKTKNKKYLIARNNYLKTASEEELPADCESKGHNSGMSKVVSDTFSFFMKHEGDEKNIGIREIRIIWVNYLEVVKDVKERTRLAKLMGHSLEMATNVYLRKTEGKVKESSKLIKEHPDYGEKGYIHDKKKIMKGIDTRFD